MKNITNDNKLKQILHYFQERKKNKEEKVLKNK